MKYLLTLFIGILIIIFYFLEYERNAPLVEAISGFSPSKTKEVKFEDASSSSMDKKQNIGLRNKSDKKSREYYLNFFKEHVTSHCQLAVELNFQKNNPAESNDCKKQISKHKRNLISFHLKHIDTIIPLLELALDVEKEMLEKQIGEVQQRIQNSKEHSLEAEKKDIERLELLKALSKGDSTNEMFVRLNTNLLVEFEKGFHFDQILVSDIMPIDRIIKSLENQKKLLNEK